MRSLPEVQRRQSPTPSPRASPRDGVLRVRRGRQAATDEHADSEGHEPRIQRTHNGHGKRLSSILSADSGCGGISRLTLHEVAVSARARGACTPRMDMTLDDEQAVPRARTPYSGPSRRDRFAKRTHRTQLFRRGRPSRHREGARTYQRTRSSDREGRGSSDAFGLYMRGTGLRHCPSSSEELLLGAPASLRKVRRSLRCQATSPRSARDPSLLPRRRLPMRAVSKIRGRQGSRSRPPTPPGDALLRTSRRCPPGRTNATVPTGMKVRSPRAS